LENSFWHGSWDKELCSDFLPLLALATSLPTLLAILSLLRCANIIAAAHVIAIERNLVET
jgi:hypothetical protein